MGRNFIKIKVCDFVLNSKKHKFSVKKENRKGYSCSPREVTHSKKQVSVKKEKRKGYSGFFKKRNASNSKSKRKFF